MIRIYVVEVISLKLVKNTRLIYQKDINYPIKICVLIKYFIFVMGSRKYIIIIPVQTKIIAFVLLRFWGNSAKMATNVVVIT